MTTEADFLAAIHAEPDDRHTVGVFADWLEENDDPRAALVRALLAGEGIDLNAAAAQPLRRLRAVGEVRPDPRGLLRMHLVALPPPDAHRMPNAWGWVTAVSVARIDLLRRLANVVWRLPFLRRLTLRPSAGQLAGWMQTPLQLPRPLDLRLEVDDGPGNVVEQLQHLGEWLPPGTVRELAVRRCKLNDAGVARLLRAAGLEHLRRLELDDNAIGPEGVAALAACPSLANLESLSLAGNAIACPGLEALVAPGHLPALRELGLARTQLGMDGLALWLRSRFAPPLTADVAIEAGVEFRRTFTPAGPCIELTGWDLVSDVALLPLPDEVTQLALHSGRNWMPGDTARLFAVPAFAHLRALSLTMPEVLSDGVRELFTHPVAAAVEVLTVCGRFATTALDAPALGRRRKLELNDPDGQLLRLTTVESGVALTLGRPSSFVLDALARSPDVGRITEVHLIAPASGLTVRLARLVPNVHTFHVRDAAFLYEDELRALALAFRPGQLRELRLPVAGVHTENPELANLRARFPLIEDRTR